ITVCLCSSFFFFFSSRRRHTRSLRDWSSDVCSSDLKWISPAWPRKVISIYTPFRKVLAKGFFYCLRDLPPQAANPASNKCMGERSEERRVGKECRSRWGRDQ